MDRQTLENMKFLLQEWFKGGNNSEQAFAFLNDVYSGKFN